MSTKSKQEKIEEGIRYIVLLNRGNNVFDIAEDLELEPEYIKECIALAWEHKDQYGSKVKVNLIPPQVEVNSHYPSGRLQSIDKVELELKYPIVAKYSEDDLTEFIVTMPVQVRIIRNSKK